VVGDQQWEIVWRHAANRVDEGLDADTALRRAAEQLAALAAEDPMDDYRYTAHALVTELSTQRQAGAGQHPRAVVVGPTRLHRGSRRP
jgi:hypothetical protein